jgi:uncharacterized repeat protein (TIGR03803 family)
MRALRLAAVLPVLSAPGLIYSLLGSLPGFGAQAQPQGQGGAVQPTPGFSVLYSFDGRCAGSPGAHCDPAVQNGVGVKVGAMVHGPDGDDSFYGTTPGGGAHNNGGTIFKITPTRRNAGSPAWAVVEVLYSFGNGLQDGRNPSGGLTLGGDGNLYGTTYAGGVNGVGTIFRMARRAGKPEILYSFRGGRPDPPLKGQPPPPPLTPTQIDDYAAAYPVSPPVLGRDGNLYGVTPLSNPGGGVLYQFTPGGALRCLHRFKFENGEPKEYGLYPSTLTQGWDGFLYGTTLQGARGEFGTVFQFQPPSAGNDKGSITKIFTFAPGGDDGSLPNGVIQGKDGSLYGTTYSGGRVYRGVVFRLAVTGQYTVLFEFGGNAANPVVGVTEVLAPDPVLPESCAPQTQSYYLYGASALSGMTGFLFRLREDGDGKDLCVVHNFDGATGALPNVAPVPDGSNPGLFGITAGGGQFNAGVFYQLNPLIPSAPAAQAMPPPAYARPAGAACWCDVPNFSPPSACRATWAPIKGRWSGHHLALPEGDVYTDYCFGAKVDGIMFLPKAADCNDTLGATVNTCAVADIHVRQFVKTTCLATGKDACGTNYSSSCGGTRNFDVWYLDECSAAPGYYIPDLPGPQHLIADQPDTFINSKPVRKSFYDFVMCGEKVNGAYASWKVLDAYSWTRSETGTSGNRCVVPARETYSAPRGENPQTLPDVVCTFENAPAFQRDAGLEAIRAQFLDVPGCKGWSQPGK